ncbi:MAG: thioredoxin-dependent thiol peroxidase [Alicyclobacillaceae bacterium]|nr:thioredoxin-dependent thiol peroxidase [Alicyclobacillaceae bacterium]
MAELAVGQQAPDFTLPTHSGAEVSLSDLRGKVVVLYFYPKDDTPGCTREACSFRDLRAEFAAAGAEIYGVSRDSVESHAKFADKYDLTFPLLADVDGSVCRAYGVLKEKTMFGKTSLGIERTTFVIDREGKIAKIFPKVKVDGHADQVLKVVRAL